MSLSFVYGDKNKPAVNQVLCDFARVLLGEAIEFGPSMTFGVMRDGNILGAVVFHDFVRERGTIEITVTAQSSRWLTRKVVNEIARLAFEANGCQMMFGRCDASKTTTDRILSTIGFQKVTLPNMRGKGRDESLFYLTQDAWNLSRFKI